MSLWKQLPDSLKYGLLFVVAIFTLIGVIRIDDLRAIFNPPKVEDQLSTVKFILTDVNSNEPVSNASVVFIFNGAPEPRYTDDFGYVSITIPIRQEVRVKVLKTGYKAINRTLNLTADSEKTVEYKMEPISNENQSLQNQAEEFNQDSSTNGNTEVLGGDNLVIPASDSPQSSQIQSPVDFVELYFYRVEHGLYQDAFDMLSSRYLDKTYYVKGFTLESAIQNYEDYWNRCDIDHRKTNEEYSQANSAVVTYERRLFCDDDGEVGRSHDFTLRQMELIKNSDDSDWLIDSVYPK